MLITPRVRLPFDNLEEFDKSDYPLITTTSSMTDTAVKVSSLSIPSAANLFILNLFWSCNYTFFFPLLCHRLFNVSFQFLVIFFLLLNSHLLPSFSVSLLLLYLRPSNTLSPFLYFVMVLFLCSPSHCPCSAPPQSLSSMLLRVVTYLPFISFSCTFSPFFVYFATALFVFRLLLLPLQSPFSTILSVVSHTPPSRPSTFSSLSQLYRLLLSSTPPSLPPPYRLLLALS